MTASPALSDDDPSRSNLEAMTVTALAPNFAAEVTGVDLSQPISPPLAQALRDAIARYRVIVVRDQRLDADQQEAFSRVFGEVQEHVGRLKDGSRLPPVHEISNVGEDGKPTDKPYLHATAYWHTDGAHFPVPPSYTILHAVELPPEGGDTAFADMIAAFAALPEARRRELEGISVVHSYGEKHLNIGGPPGKEAEVRDAPPVKHSLVRVDPRTGTKGLYIGMYAVRIPGMEDEAARRMLRQLLEHATQPQFVWTQVWRQGDVLMWDNRWVLHRAVQNFDGTRHRRVMRRTVVKGIASN